MARTLRQIELALADSIEGQDSSVDTVKGPVFDIFIRPISAQLRATELQYDDLSRRFSLDYVLTQNQSVLQLYGANHGLRRAGGKAAGGYVLFYTYAAPGPDSIVVVPSGTVVSTTDTTISFRTTRDAFILGSSLGAFFNAAERRYEVRVPVTALGSGQLFEVPPNRILKIQSSVRGIDGVINKERISGSTEQEPASKFGKRIRSKFNGLGLGSGSGLEQLIRQFSPSSILDVKIIYSTDLEHFRRPTRRASMDVYLIGSVSDTAEATFIGNASTRTFVLPQSPVLGVSSVRVGNTSVGFTFIPDEAFSSRKSTRSQDKVELSVIPGLNETVTVTYTYDKLTRDVQAYVDRLGVQLYRTDILVRKAIPVPVRASFSFELLSSFDETEAASAALDAVISFVNKEEFVSTLSASSARDYLSAEVAGASKVKVVEFTRDLSGTLPVETIEFYPYEYPETNASLVTVTL